MKSKRYQKGIGKSPLNCTIVLMLNVAYISNNSAKSFIQLKNMFPFMKVTAVRGFKIGLHVSNIIKNIIP